MAALLAFALLLLIGALSSRIADRTVLSVSVLFLAGGAVLGWTGVFSPTPDDDGVLLTVEILLFAVLFSDAVGLRHRDLADWWRRPGLALLIGLPITAMLIAAAAHPLLGLPWPQALLLGIVLSPTDPVFARGLIGKASVPLAVRRMLNIESGVNDGVALPLVLLLIAFSIGNDPHPATLLVELVGGIAIGIVMPFVLHLIARIPHLGYSEEFQVVAVTGLAIAIYATARITGANPFLAAFAGGVTTATLDPETASRFQRWAQPAIEIGKLGGVLLFGAAIATAHVDLSSARVWVLAVGVLLLARPLALVISIAWTRMDRIDWLAVAWFGPKGFSSIAYAMLVVGSATPQRTLVFEAAAAAIFLSIVAHSSTDVPIAKLFARRKGEQDRGRHDEGSATEREPA